MNHAAYIFKLFGDNPGRYREITNRIADTVVASFHADRSTPTQAEIKRRIQICNKWFIELYKGLSWASRRALDELPKALRCELDGIDYTPSREGKSSWGADNAADLIWLP